MTARPTRLEATLQSLFGYANETEQEDLWMAEELDEYRHIREGRD